MLIVAGLLVARHRGPAMARLALQAGADFLARREMPNESGVVH
jgi:hypothetical protein